MNNLYRRFSIAVMTALTLAGPATVQGQERTDSRTKGHFVQLRQAVINLEQISYIDLDPNKGGEGTVEVFFGGGPRSILVHNRETRKLLDAIRGDNPSLDAGDESTPLPLRRRSRRTEAQPETVEKDDVVPEGSRVLLFDDFAGKLGLNWKPVRPDASHVSLTKNPGKFTITTQLGSIHGEQPTDENGNPTPAKNLYLIDNPLAKGSDFVLTTCVSGFTPTMSYQQAGLILYGDDDNYLKWAYEFHWNQGEGQLFRCVTEKDAVPEHLDGEVVAGLNRYWLRITKRGDRYEYATSLDGKTYRVHGETTWGDGSPPRFGILAKNGGMKEATELDAAFEFFELRPLTTEKPGVAFRKE